MLRSLKKFSWVVFFAAGLQAVWGFALLGPGIGGGLLGDDWEKPVIGYGLGGDIGTPKNIGEEYRRNTPVLYYTYDANFIEFFGSNGMVAVDQAFGIMNSLTNVTSYSASLSEFPLNSQHINFTAQSLGLSDLKSDTLNLLTEQMGLAEPERYTWTLHDRFHVTGFGACPEGMEYLVVQRNYDVTASLLNQLQYSPYVNGTLYSYLIFEGCNTTPASVTQPFAVDPFADSFTAVASFGLETGGFYTGLTRDDVAGLRYLLQTNNVNRETAALGSVMLTTNLLATNIIQNLNLGSLLSTALTNDPVTLAGLFPNVVVANVSNYFTVICTPNIVSYLTNFYGEPVGTAPHFVIATNGFTCAPATNYVYGFANVITNAYTTNTRAKLITVSIGQKIKAPIGSPLVTNVITKDITLTNVPSGDYFIIPPGQCGWIVNPSPFISNGSVVTNVLFTTTATNSDGFVYSQSIITYFTNRYYFARPVICGTVAGGIGLYQGINNIKFVRANFDSLIGQFFQPVTNTYSMVLVTNSQPVRQYFQRVVTAPDFLLTAQDLTSGPSVAPSVPFGSRSISYNQNNVLSGLAGPGTINPQTVFTYNKVGDIFFNGTAFTLTTNAFLNELNQFQVFAWASFDASTNDPVIYPNGTTIADLENQLLVQITPPPPTLSDGTNGVPYATTIFSATGGSFQPPFTWSATGLPSGLVVAADGTLSGTPSQSGIFDVIVQLTDFLSRSVQWNYSINIQ